MLKQASDKLIALFAGGLLALMIAINSDLALVNTPLQASWVAHGIGALVAMCLVGIGSVCFQSLARSNRHHSNGEIERKTSASLSYWAYLGGLPGSLTVALAAMTVNSEIGLSGTLACALIGQIIFGMISDHLGLFNSQKKAFVIADLFKVIPIIAGSFILIFI